MARSASARLSRAARTIRFRAALHDQITRDAERRGRSVEAQVLALLRRHYGEDVDTAPRPHDFLALPVSSSADIRRATRVRFESALASVPDSPPDEDDDLPPGYRKSTAKKLFNTRSKVSGSK